MNVIRKARIIAKQAHESIDQRRKYTNTPYFVHPERVSKIVRENGGDDNMIAAALLHDVLEDTPVTEEMLRELVGDEVTDLVVELTNVAQPEDGNRAERMRIDRERLAKVSPAAQTIKCADIIDNVKDIRKYDPEFAEVYIPEKERELDVLTKADPGIHNRAKRVLRGEPDGSGTYSEWFPARRKK